MENLEQLKAENTRLKEEVESGHHKHGASGLCCQLREQEKQRADNLQSRLTETEEKRDEHAGTLLFLEDQISLLKKELTETEKMVVGLEEALLIAKAGLWDLEQMGKAQAAVEQALSQVPQSLAQKFV